MRNSSPKLKVCALFALLFFMSKAKENGFFRNRMNLHTQPGAAGLSDFFQIYVRATVRLSEFLQNEYF